MTRELNFRYLAITDRRVCPEPIADRARKLINYGVPAIQLRDKDLPDRDRFGLLKKMQTFSKQILINGRFDLAILASCGGVHAPTDRLPLDIIRDAMDDSMLLGVSVHGFEEARACDTELVDYMLFGPVFPTESKPELNRSQIPGLEVLESVADSIDTPIFALGGIDSTRVQECLSAGAFGVAGIRALMQPENPKEEWLKISKQLSESD